MSYIGIAGQAWTSPTLASLASITCHIHKKYVKRTSMGCAFVHLQHLKTGKLTNASIQVQSSHKE